MAATVALSTGPYEVINFLTPGEIPTKLRCATCNKLALDAHRLPCCSQSICDDCLPTLPETCPVCEHSPVTKDSVKPNKALRMTIKAFLKTKTSEKKAEMSAARAQVEVTKAQPASATPNEQAEISSSSLLLDQPNRAPETQVESIKVDQDFTYRATDDKDMSGNKHGQVMEKRASSVTAPKDIPKQSIEKINSGDATMTSPILGTNSPINALVRQDRVEPSITEDGTIEELQNPSAEQWNQGQMQRQESTNGVGTVPDGQNANGLLNQSWTTGFHPMAPMQNGMMGGMWGMPNMMGMPGLNMDPMSQGMYGGFGGQGMGIGMNGMNMGMDMGFNSGQSGYGSWNGQTWQAGQNNFSHNANGLHGNGLGDFGTNHGYNATGGYHQPHGYNHMHQQQFLGQNYRGNYHQGQGGYQRGRGRGYGYQQGRGGSMNHMHQNGPNAFSEQFSSPQQSEATNRRGSPTYENEAPKKAETSPIKATENVGPEHATSEKIPTEVPPVEQKEQTNAKEDTNVKETIQTDTPEAEPNNKAAVDKPLAEASQMPGTVPVTSGIDSRSANVGNGVSIPSGPAALAQHDKSRRSPSRGQGYPDTNMQGSTYRSQNGMEQFGVPPRQPQPIPVVESSMAPPPEPRGIGVAGAPTGPKALRQGLPNTGFRGRGGFMGAGRGVSMVVSVPGAPTQPKSAVVDRRRSRSPSSAHSRNQNRRESYNTRHHHRSSSSSDNEDDEAKERRRERRHRHSKRHSDEEDRSRSPSLSPRRSSHRSSRHDRDRDRSRTHKSSKESRSERNRDRDRSRDRRHRRHHSRSPVEDETTARDDSRRERKERHRERKGSKTEPPTPTSDGQPEINSHDLEREARNRERLLRDQQRKDEISRESKKRGRDEDVDEEKRRSKKRHGRGSYKYEDDEDVEEKLARAEREREAARWA